MTVEDDLRAGPQLMWRRPPRLSKPGRSPARPVDAQARENSTAAHPVASGSARCGDSGAPCRARKTRVGRQLGTRAPLWRPVNLIQWHYLSALFSITCEVFLGTGAEPCKAMKLGMVRRDCPQNGAAPRKDARSWLLFGSAGVTGRVRRG